MTEKLVTKHYPIKVAFSDEDECYIAEAPDLPGCKAHGDTPEEAVKEVRSVINLWIEVAIEQNKDIPEPGKI